jgi:hypothetical protein
MAGAVVPAQLSSGRPRESGGPIVPQTPASGIPAFARTTPDGCQPLSPLAPSSRLSISILRLIFAFRFVFTFVSSSPSSPAPLSHRGPLSFALPPSNEGQRSAGAGHWHSRRACEARRVASRATGGRLTALHVAIFGCGTGASSSGSAHRNPRRDFAHGRALAPGRSGPHLPRPRFAPGPQDATPRSALRAPPAAPRTSEVMRNVAMMRYVVKSRKRDVVTGKAAQ